MSDLSPVTTGARGASPSAPTSQSTDQPLLTRVRRVTSGKWRRYQWHGKAYTPFKDRLRNFGDIFRFGFGLVQSFFRLLFWRPDVIFLKGGFVSLPVGLAAHALRIPFVIHESDGSMGLTNRILARYAAKVAVGLPTHNPELVYTGVPVGEEWEAARLMDDRTAAALLAERAGLKNLKSPLVVVVGGGNGARHLTNLISHLKLSADRVILAGPAAETKRQGRVLVRKNLPIDQGLPQLLRLADVVVARAGATTLSELAILGKAVLIVPKDVLPGGHQTENAERLATAGAALALPEEEIDQKLAGVLQSLLDDAALRGRLARKMHSLAVPDAAARLADLIEQVGQGA